MRIVATLLCLTACSAADGDDGPDADCIARAGVYDTVESWAAASGNCPASIVDEFGEFGTVTVSPGRPCGLFRPSGGFAVDCSDGGCSGGVLIDAVADADGVRDGTITLRSSCGDESCTTIDPQCEHVIPLQFVYLSEPP